MKLEPSEMFKALGVETRVKILGLLRCRGRLGVKEMAEALGITASAVSQHLKVLRYAGLVRNERKGYTLPYEIDHVAMAQCRKVISEVCNCGCKGSCQAQDKNVHEPQDDLALLLERERELREELQELRVRIKRIKAEE